MINADDSSLFKIRIELDAEHHFKLTKNFGYAKELLEISGLSYLDYQSRYDTVQLLAKSAHIYRVEDEKKFFLFAISRGLEYKIINQ